MHNVLMRLPRTLNASTLRFRGEPAGSSLAMNHRGGSLTRPAHIPSEGMRKFVQLPCYARLKTSGLGLNRWSTTAVPDATST